MRVFPLLHPVVQAVPGMAFPLPVFTLVVLLLAKSPVCHTGDCKGHRQVLRGSPGYVTDGPGNYSVNGNCEWLIKGIVFCISGFQTQSPKCCVAQPTVNDVDQVCSLSKKLESRERNWSVFLEN